MYMKARHPDSFYAFGALDYSAIFSGQRRAEPSLCKQVDAMIDQGLREQDRKKRVRIYQDLQRYLYTADSAGVVVGWQNGWYFTDKKLKNYHMPPTSYDNNTYMAVWLDQ
jgi:ABC-type transport system substrate-binding protein